MSVLSENRPPVFGYYVDDTFVAVKESKIDFIEANKGKLNEKTIDYLKYTINKTENKNYIIKFKDSIKKEKLSGISINKEYSRFKSVKIKTNFNKITKLLNDSDIKYIELDQNIQLLEDEIPYGVNNVLAPSAWSLTHGNDVKIAVLDSGVSPHDDLTIMGGYSVISEDYTDGYGHGTAVTGVISALLNDNGLVGVAPSSEIYAVKIMESSLGDLSDAISGLGWAIDNNVDIISMSFGFDFYSQIFKEAVQEAYSSDILLIAASGNDNTDVLYPAAYTDVIAVGAVDSNNEKAPFSSYGYELELVAPGVDISSTALNNGYSIYSGTSMAAPHVTGVAALIKSYDYSLTNTEIRGKLRNDALDLGAVGKDDYYGFGLVQVNLSSSDYGLQNESYFYEIFNIINYKTPEEDYIFWLNGTGTIDDVDFSEGYYLIKKYLDEVIEYKIRVDESGKVKLLWTLDLIDDFIYNSTNSDFMAWINGNLYTFINDSPGGNRHVHAECYDYDGDYVYEECYYNNTAAKTSCESFSQSESGTCTSFYDICNQGQGTCSQGILQNHTINSSVIGEKQINILIYDNCDSPSLQQCGETEIYDYIFDRKQTRCTGTSTYQYEGRYSNAVPVPGDNYYHPYKTSISCPSGAVCNTALDEKPVADANGTIPDPCYTGNDLYIGEDDILVLKQDSQTNFTATIHAVNVNATNIKITFYGMKNNDDIKSETKTLNFTSSDTSKTVSVKWNVNFENIKVAVDSTNVVSENNEENNQAEVSATRTKAYLNISTGMPLVDAKIEDYLKKYVDSVSEANAGVIIAVDNPRKNDLVDEYNQYTLGALNWGYDDRVKYNGKTGKQLYNAIVGSFYYISDGKTRVFAYGNEIEGTIAAVKRLIDEKDKFLKDFKNENKETYLGKYDFDAYSVWDIMHQSTNEDAYGQNSDTFAAIVDQLLNDESYEESIRYVTESKNNTQLRIKHVASGLSTSLQNAVSETPVVLSRGLWSNLLTWEEFGQELATEGRDVWLIEITGGSTTECDNCPNYDFQDLIQYYYPALIDGVLDATGKSELQYVGFSNGCRVALSSLEDGHVNPSKVETFVGVGCPGAFNGTSVGELLIKVGDYYIDITGQEDALVKLENTGRSHFTVGEVVANGFMNKGKFKLEPTGKISLNLLKNYSYWIENNTDPQPGKNLNLDNFVIIQGTFFVNSDGIVTTYDEQAIYDNIILNNPPMGQINRKRYFSIFAPHMSLYVIKSLADVGRTKNIITKSINKEELNFFENARMIEEETKS